MSGLLKLIQVYQNDHDLTALLESGGAILSDPEAARKELEALSPKQKEQAEAILMKLLETVGSKQKEIEKELAGILQDMKAGQKSADACVSYSKADAHAKGDYE